MSSFSETSKVLTNQSDNIKSQKELNIDFNYPSLNRKDLMYLSTVTNNDFPLRKFKQLHTNRNWSINLYNLDIEGSSPRKFGAFNQKRDYTNQNDDIEKSSPKQLHVQLKKPNYNLSNSDIELSQPTCVKTKIKRHLNPLEPKYLLPKCPEYPPYQPKFIRDSISIKDIEGTNPRKKMSYKLLRDSLKNDDVKDSWPKKPYIRKTEDYNYIDYRDVTNTDFQTTRETNPLDPFYTMKFVDGTKSKFGPIEKSKPQVGSMYMYKPPLNLKLDDIQGTDIGSKNNYRRFQGKNFCYDISDIIGAQSGTLLKGISTKRKTNPLRPKYKYLGETELKGYYENNPYNNYNTVTSFNTSRSIHNNTKDNNNDAILVQENNINEKVDMTNNKNGEKEKMTTHPQREVGQDKKLLDKNVNIAKNSKIIIGPDGMPDFRNFPYVEDVIEFDKDKYKKTENYYSIKHDKFLIPPIEEYKRKQIKVNPGLRTFQEVSQERLKFMNKKKVSKILSFPHKSYANKLDDFLTSTNYKYNGSSHDIKSIEPFLETGLPDSIQPGKKLTENKNTPTQSQTRNRTPKAV